ncbi:hypothetical protein VP01_6559g1 [Puccinia sorghi]|uniref:Uncharacterized protein n=1 Tax=Puccinia sorghi TaxID=27349 RepID=A0A0L6UHJ2_9BASI|nr:hypothetical protein VP01_6559g1 [Puccinia sorghi]
MGKCQKCSHGVISSNIPSTSLKNTYSPEYPSELAKSPNKLPRQVQMIEKSWPIVYAWNDLEMLEKLRDKIKSTYLVFGCALYLASFQINCKTSCWLSNDESHCKGEQNLCEIFHDHRILAGESIFTRTNK